MSNKRKEPTVQDVSKTAIFVCCNAAAVAAPASAQTLPGCPNQCGNLTFLGITKIEVLNISVQGQLRISIEAAYDCSNEAGNITRRARSILSVPKFPLSYRQNKFTATGCDTSTLIQGKRAHTYATGYAFVVEEKAYDFSVLDLADLRSVTKFPVVLDWAIGNETCSDAQKKPETYACKDNSICHDSDNGPGYRCNCSDGYSGNPYLANGCKDIDECAIPSVNLCTHSCKNTPGNYTGYCPKGHKGDGRKDGIGCTRIKTSHTGIAIGVGIGVIVLLVASSWLYLVLKERKLIKLKAKFFRQNGGFMLKQKLCSPEGTSNATKLCTADELKRPPTTKTRVQSLVKEASRSTKYASGGTREMSKLPETEGCVAHVLSFTSPQEACRLSLISHTFNEAANSDIVWNSFLSADYQSIVSRSSDSSLLASRLPRKQIFLSLCDNPILIDDGKMARLGVKVMNMKILGIVIESFTGLHIA
ncbi:hypothetical protein GH714_022283 [Hevea brasiliensis]|uniref:EGF-like domain-containing protein n=1 Tax=Hevea brasiliensis TaxID=3981 RepID=A0A6A6KTC3_HEVBR|nr:hypothetical protein GH714_022283 [Hevea brasiliensis]